jgi:hypothetical protein
MIHRLSLPAAWLALAFIAFATLSPIGDRPVLPGPQFEHFAGFALVGFAFVLAYPRHTLLRIVIVIGSAFALEALQLLTPDRHGRIGAGELGMQLLRRPIHGINELLRLRRAAN